MSVFYRVRELIEGKINNMVNNDVPKFIYLDENIKEDILAEHSSIRELVCNSPDVDSVVFVVSPVPSPYVDGNGRMYLGKEDFNSLMPHLLELFSSYKKGIPVREAFEHLIRRLTGEYNGQTRSY